jgi:rSAM/selenodomain-associated transferase 1
MKVVVFAKAPLAGHVKTRLAPALGAAGAAELHRRLVRRTLRTAIGADVGSVELCCAPDARHGFFADCAAEHGVELTAQGPGDVGERMARAFDRAAPAVLIGSDCPALESADIAAAARALDRADVALVPAEDGGYVLIALRAPAPGVFADIAWGASDVLLRTRARIAALGMSSAELASLWDVDRPADLERIAALDVALLEGLR